MIAIAAPSYDALDENSQYLEMSPEQVFAADRGLEQDLLCR